MVSFLIQRLVMMIPTLFVVSVISFLIMQAPPGDFLTSYIARLAANGEQIDLDQIESLRATYGLDRPWTEQYWLCGTSRRATCCGTPS